MINSCNIVSSFSVSAPQKLLDAIANLESSTLPKLKIKSKFHAVKGCGLYATEDISPGELLLEVPWDYVFADEVSGSLHRPPGGTRNDLDNQALLLSLLGASGA